jgi:hypothetical protein
MNRIIILILISFTVLSCKKEKPVVVKYTINCQNCTATYFDRAGEFSDRFEVESFFEHEFEAESGFSAMVSAQNPGDTSSVKVEIFINSELRRSSSNGGYAFAAASATYPL